MQRTVEEIARFVQAQVVGEGTVPVTGVASVDRAATGDLVFVEGERNLDAALLSNAAAIISAGCASGKSYAKPLLIVSQPRLAFARAARLFHEESSSPAGIHPSAMLPASARVDGDATLEEGVILGEEVSIGGGSRIGAGTVVGRGVSIGRDCRLYPNVAVYPGVRIGNRVIIHAGAVLGGDGFGYVRDQATGRYEKFPQVGRLEIEDDVEIGANSTIDRGALEVTRIGRGTKIDNLVHIGHNCQIGEDVVIAAQTGLSGSIVIEKNVVLGGQVGIGEHARVEEGVMLGGQGGVLPKKILRGKGVVFWGTPASPVRAYLKQLALLARLAKRE
jgi:UDP-3-O-[3-hydroxymyristoyl] glucosamine N-acyltransferase